MKENNGYNIGDTHNTQTHEHPETRPLIRVKKRLPPFKGITRTALPAAVFISARSKRETVESTYTQRRYLNGRTSAPPSHEPEASARDTLRKREWVTQRRGFTISLSLSRTRIVCRFAETCAYSHACVMDLLTADRFARALIDPSSAYWFVFARWLGGGARVFRIVKLSRAREVNIDVIAPGKRYLRE